MTSRDECGCCCELICYRSGSNEDVNNCRNSCSRGRREESRSLNSREHRYSRRSSGHNFNEWDLSPTREVRHLGEGTDWNDRLGFFSAIASVHHPEGCQRCEKNAVIVSKNALGVFSGVGECRCDYDPGAYPRELARMVDDYLDIRPSRKIVRGLRRASQLIESKGKATVCVIGREAKDIVGVDIGDCGFIIIRNGEIVYWLIYEAAPDHCPMTLGSSPSDESVDDGTPFEFEIEPGDFIILGSIGLWERLHMQDVRDILLSEMRHFHDSLLTECSECRLKKKKKFTDVAETLANLAHSIAESNEWTNVHYSNDELNDVTVVVSIVTDDTAAHSCIRSSH